MKKNVKHNPGCLVGGMCVCVCVCVCGGGGGGAFRDFAESSQIATKTLSWQDTP